MDNNVSKKSLRHDMSCKRNMLTAQDIDILSEKIFSRLLSLNILTDKKSILTYVSYKSEVKTYKIIDYCFNNSISVYAPKVKGECMDFYKISSYKELDYGAYGILEPINENIYVENYDNNCISEIHKPYDIIIMPGLIFDTDGNRLGYGGGYYDRYLSKYNNLYKIAICYDFQIIDNNIISAEPHDIKPDIIITDKRIINVT